LSRASRGKPWTFGVAATRGFGPFKKEFPVRDRNVRVILEFSHMTGAIACVTAATLVLVAGCGGGSAGAPSEPGAPTDRGIVFSSKRDGDFEIYLMDPDGSDVRQLTRNESQGENEADEGSPSWSPDGRRIAFTSTRDHEGDGFDSEGLYVMEAPGAGQTRLTENESGEGGPSWSPDGEWLVFARRAVEQPATEEEALKFKLELMRPDGSETKTLFEPDALLVTGASWSPDGKELAFTGCEIVERQLDCEVWVANADGSDAKKLTDGPGRSAGPAWSPDGGRIAFTSDRDMNGDCFFHDCTGWNGEIYVMNADGSDPKRLTDDPGDDASPTWSPDGTRIAFSALRNVEGGVDDPSENYEIFVMNADGSDLVQLTNNTSWDWQPDWY
jgi:Tol biopolymer transport system component